MHLEALLPAKEAGRGTDGVKHVYIGAADILPEWVMKRSEMPYQLTDQDLTNFLHILERFHMKSWEIIVLTEKLCYNRTYREIAEMHGFTGHQAVCDIFHASIKKLRAFMTKAARE